MQGTRAAFCTSPWHRASESNAVLRTWKPVARHGLLGIAPRTRIELVSLDRQSSCDASRITRLGLRRRVERLGLVHSQTRSPELPQHQSAASESNGVLSLFRRALNDPTSSRPVTRRGYDPRVVGLKDRPPHQRFARREADNFFCAACQGWSRSAESNRARLVTREKPSQKDRLVGGDRSRRRCLSRARETRAPRARVERAMSSG